MGSILTDHAPTHWHTHWSWQNSEQSLSAENAGPFVCGYQYLLERVFSKGWDDEHWWHNIIICVLIRNLICTNQIADCMLSAAIERFQFAVGEVNMMMQLYWEIGHSITWCSLPKRVGLGISIHACSLIPLQKLIARLSPRLLLWHLWAPCQVHV